MSSAYPSTTRALTPQLADSLLHYSDDDQLQVDNLGDLTPTSNRTPSPPSSALYNHSAPHSPQSATSSTGSDASSIMSLPPLSIPPRILDALHRELAEKSQLLSLANDHIQHQSVQIQHMQAKLTSYQEANNAMLSANVGTGPGPSGGRSEEVKQLKVLVSHLYNMIAQRDAIVDEQEVRRTTNTLTTLSHCCSLLISQLVCSLCLSRRNSTTTSSSSGSTSKTGRRK